VTAPALDRSTASRIAHLRPADRLAYVRALPKPLALAALYDWRIWARPKQLMPRAGEIRNGIRVGFWYLWLILAGRGWGKTRTGAETVRTWVEEHPDGRRPLRLALVAETAADARDVMVEGPGGIMAVSPPWNRPIYEPSKRRLTWLRNGRVVAIATLFAGDAPNQLRGPGNDKAWCDELAKYRYAEETWANLEMTLREGDDPQVIVTTTPRPVKLLRDLMDDVGTGATFLTQGTTYENAGNLAAKFFDRVRRRYEGTRLGLQELHARMLDEMPGSLWTRNLLDRTRIRPDRFGKLIVPPMDRIAVALDPSGSSNEDSDEAGIVVAGRAINGDAYVWDDRSDVMSPAEWGRRAILAYHQNTADIIVGEKNFGGDQVETIVRMIDDTVNFRAVTASRGKHIRAEPIASLYEQDRVHHVGDLARLEDELCQFTTKGYKGGTSPNRGDAAVFALTELMLENDFDDGEGWPLAQS
jgi:phage terminase large subunit-like protein